MTYTKANASWKIEYVKQMEEVTNEYLERLGQYEKAVRSQLEAKGKSKSVRYRKWKEKAETINRREDKVGPESGFHKCKGKAERMHYLSHETVNPNNGTTIDVAAAADNVSNSEPCIERADYTGKNLGLEIQGVYVDSGYGASLINQQLSERDIDLHTPEKIEQKRRTMRLQRKDFQYDEEKDVFICSGKKELPLHRLNRTIDTVTKECRYPRTICKKRPLHNGCIGERRTDKRIQIDIFEEVVKKNHEKDDMGRYMKVLLLRQIWGGSSFATQKARHDLKFLYRKGLEAAEQQRLLSSAALNLKRIIKAMA